MAGIQSHVRRMEVWYGPNNRSCLGCICDMDTTGRPSPFSAFFCLLKGPAVSDHFTFLRGLADLGPDRSVF
jgi:hypothetical protein